MSTTATRTATATHQPGSSGSAVRLPSPRVHSAHVPAPTSRQPARGRIQLSEVPFASAMNDRDLALLGACWTSRRRLMLVNLSRLGAPSDAASRGAVGRSSAPAGARVGRVARDRGRGEWIKGVRYSLLEDLTAPTAPLSRSQTRPPSNSPLESWPAWASQAHVPRVPAARPHIRKHKLDQRFELRAMP